MPKKDVTEKQKELIEDSLGDLLDGLYSDVLGKVSETRPNLSDEEKTNVLNNVNNVLKSNKDFNKAAKKGGEEVESILTNNPRIKTQAESIKEQVSPYYKGAKTTAGKLANAARRARKEIDLNTIDPFEGRADYIKTQREAFKKNITANDKLNLLQHYGESEGISTLDDAKNIIEESLNDRAESFPASERKRETRDEALKKLPRNARKELEKSYEYKEALSDIDKQTELIQQEQDIVDLEKAKSLQENLALSPQDLVLNGFSEETAQGVKSIKETKDLTGLDTSPREYIISRNLEQKYQQEQQKQSAPAQNVAQERSEQSSIPGDERKPAAVKKPKKVFGSDKDELTYFQDDFDKWENPRDIPTPQDRGNRSRRPQGDRAQREASTPQHNHEQQRYAAAPARAQESQTDRENQQYRPRARNRRERNEQYPTAQKHAAQPEPRREQVSKNNHYYQSTRAIAVTDTADDKPLQGNRSDQRRNTRRENPDTAQGLSELIPSEDRIRQFEKQFKEEQKRETRDNNRQAGQTNYRDRFDPNNRGGNNPSGRDGR